jgi:serine/threonine-protein kinase PknK
MAAPHLLVTKFHGPSNGGQWVARERLLADLAERHRGRRCRACVVAAAGGFGKTTLAAQWAERLRRDGEAVSWLTLEKDDDDAERLCEYLLAGIHEALPAVDPQLASLLAGGAPDAPTRALTAAINAIAAAKTRMTLILDDCHHLEGPRACELLRFLLARSPENLHLILALRPPMPLQFALLRARDEITEIDAAALRFDIGEADLLLNQLGRLEIGAEAVRQLCDRTEGWPTALRLVSLSLRGNRDRGAAGTALAGVSGGRRDVARYLAENVLDRLDERWARFLVKTSVLDRLCAGVCDAVTGEPGSQELLDRTEEAGLFLVALDGERRWFRYHHLFAEFLRQRLAASHDPPALHFAASAWFAGQGMIEEAVKHALSAGAPERALTLVDRDAMLLVQQSRMSLLLSLAEQLPPALVASRPALQIALAWARSLLHAPDEAEAVMAGLAPQDPAQAAELDLIRALNAGFQDDVERVETLLARALPHLRVDPWLLGVAANASAFVELRRGRFAAARETVLKGRQHQDRAPGSFSAVYGRCFDGLALSETGDLDGAIRCHERALEIALREVGRHGYAACMASAFLGELRYEQGDLAAAAELLEAGFTVREQSGVSDLAVALYTASARLRVARGDRDGALAVLYEGARQAASQRLDRLAAAVAHEEVRLHLVAGAPDLAARRCAAEKNDSQPLLMARVRLLLAQGRAGQARELLAPLLEAAIREGRRRFELSVRLLSAVAAADARAANAELSAAVALGAAQGAIRPLVDEGPALHALLRKLPAFGSSAYGMKVLGALKLSDAPEAVRSTLIEPLNVRELQILRLVEEGMVNQDISAALSIRLDTVKWHLKNAFKKLAVENRTAAVHAARAAGVLGSKAGQGPRLKAPVRHYPNG